MLEASVLGTIQGITEFLPVSSTAHLTIIPPLMGFEYQGRTIDVFLNLGTLLAIMLFFFKEIIALIVGMFDFVRGKNSGDKEDFITIFLASLPTIFVGAIVELIFDIAIDSTLILLVNLILFGVILFVSDFSPEEKHHVSRRHAILIGIAQTLALVPGVSRLGACLSMARFLKYSRWQSFKFSMILSVPAVAGACTLKLAKVFAGKIIINDWSFVLMGTVVSFVVGLIALKSMEKYLTKFSYKPLAIYRILFCLAFLLF